MNVDSIKRIIDSMEDDVDKVLHTSIAIEHLLELKQVIQFGEHPVKFKNELNVCVHKAIIDDLNNAIDELRNDIRFYLHYNNETNIANRNINGHRISFKR